MNLPDWLTRESALLIALAAFVIGHLAYLLWASRSNSLIDLTDLWTGDNGRLASSKSFQSWAFILSAWAMVWFTVTGHADPTGWAAWAALWVGGALGTKAIAKSTGDGKDTTGQ